MVIKAPDPDWIRIGIQPKMLDPDPDEMNADPQPCFLKLQDKPISEFQFEVQRFFDKDSSVVDPRHFSTDPDPRIRTSD